MNSSDLVFFLVWGLLYSSGIIALNVAEELFIVNLIWAASGVLQKQSSLSVMYDLWSKEFVELFRAGVSWAQYLSAVMVFGFVVGCVSLVLYMICAPLVFGVSLHSLLWLIWALPAYGLCSLSISCAGLAVVLRHSQLYGFVSGVALQLIIALSSPFVPRSELPDIWRWSTYCSPFSWTFEAVREERAGYLGVAFVLSVAWLVIAVLWNVRSFHRARAMGRLSRI